MHAGVWDKSAKGSHEVRGRTLGIVGYGNIGSQLSVVAESLGMRVYFYDVADKLALGNAQRCDSLDELLGGGRDRHPARRRPAGKRRPVRRRAVRQDAAAQPVPQPVPRGSWSTTRRCASTCSAATSPARRSTCSPTEPKAAGDPFVSSLQGLPNVILTPHIGGSTEEAQEDIGRFVAGKLADFADHGSTTMSVNLPQVAPSRPPAGPGCCTSTTTCRACWPRSTGCWPTPGSTSSGRAVHPRRPGLRDHRRRR